ncbi:MAG: hypothetical protein ACLS34_05400 [Faecalibacterium sp.]
MDKDKMLDYFNDREATLFRDELGSNARYHELLQKKLASGRRTPENGGRSEHGSSIFSWMRSAMSWKAYDKAEAPIAPANVRVSYR